MSALAVWSTFTAGPGREDEVEAFLRECRDGIAVEPGTLVFFAMRTGPGRYATYALMRDEAALEAHEGGPVAKAVLDRADELFEGGMELVRGEVIAGVPAPETPG